MYLIENDLKNSTLKNLNFMVAVYLRLSREDEVNGISESINNQRDFLIKYIGQMPNWVLVDIYIDDGYSGTNFDRPNFKRMLKDVEQGKINLVITKDLSRLRKRLYWHRALY